MVVAAFTGVGVKQTFQYESGGHRWQRIPPNEKRGRVHTSTVTVAVLDPDVCETHHIDQRDITVTTTGASGPGGQNVNKVESCVSVTHVPTGITVRISNERSQYQNKRLALQILRARVQQHYLEQRVNSQQTERRSQIGSGMRGDKIRTYRVKDDIIIDQRLGKMSFVTWERGDW